MAPPRRAMALRSRQILLLEAGRYLKFALAEGQLSSFRQRYRAFLAGWGRDLLLAGGGALTGLAIAFALGIGPGEKPSPVVRAPELVEPAAGPPPPSAAAVPRKARRYQPTPWLSDERLREAETAAKPAPVVPAWLKFAAAAGNTEGRPLIAVIIDDLGLDRGRTARTIRLPAAVTLSFLPYAHDLPRQVEAARRLGHELMVHLPMEPGRRTADPGPDALRVGETPENLRSRIGMALGKFTGYVGLNNHMGSRFTEDAASMRVVLEELGARGLLFVDSRTTARTVGPGIARELGVPFAARDVFLDDDPSPASVVAELRRVETVARRKGSAIAIGHPRDATLDALEGWLWGLGRRGFALVPVSAIVRHRRRGG